MKFYLLPDGCLLLLYFFLPGLKNPHRGYWLLWHWVWRWGGLPCFFTKPAIFKQDISAIGKNNWPRCFCYACCGYCQSQQPKQVGRMGWKSFVFLVVATFALIIGLVFINITKAGTGIKVPEALLKDLPPAVEKTWQDHIIRYIS